MAEAAERTVLMIYRDTWLKGNEVKDGSPQFNCDLLGCDAVWLGERDTSQKV